MARHHHEGQLPVVDEHHQQRAHDDRRVDHPADRPPLGELGERLDIGGDPAHQHAPPTLVVVREAQLVDVVERPGTQTQQYGFRRDHEPDVRQATRHHHADHDHHGGSGNGPDEARPVAVVAQHTTIEYLLDGDGNGQSTECCDQRQHDRDAKARAQLRTDGKTAPQHLEGRYVRNDIVVEQGRRVVGVEPCVGRAHVASAS